MLVKPVGRLGAVVLPVRVANTRIRSPTWWAGVVSVLAAALRLVTKLIVLGVATARSTIQLSGEPELTVVWVFVARSAIEKPPDAASVVNP